MVWPFSRKPVTVKGDVVQTLTPRDPTGWYPESASSDAGEFVGLNASLSLSTVWGCVNLIAGTGGTLPFDVFRSSAKGREIAKDHPLYRVLHDRPNYDQTAVDFWEFIFASVELWGNAYARILRSSIGIVGLVPIPPQLVSVRRLSNGSLQYRWSQDGVSFEETDETVLHVRGFGGDPLGGLSTLHYGRQVFGLARAIDKSAAGMFKNGMRPTGVLTMPTTLKADQRKEIESGLQTKFLGAINSGRPMILEGGVTWQSLIINPDDAQMLESRAFSVEEICRFFGCPPVMIGHTSKTTSWPTGVEQQVLMFQKFTLRRRMRRIEMAVMQQLLTPAERAAGMTVEFALEGLLRGDSAGRSKFYQTMTGIGAMTINEVRALENLPPVEGGDVPRMQMQNVPITEAGHQVEKIGGNPPDDGE